MSNVADLKGAYEGKRIFVVGNGPSLNETPFDLLRGEYSIAMNRIAILYDKTEWRPSFFVCVTNNIELSDWREDILETINLGIPTFASGALKEEIGERANVYYMQCTHGQEITNSPSLDWWSDDLGKRVCKFGTSMLVAIQIAAYLGFREIYIVGADLGFRESLPQKFFKAIGFGKYAQKFADKNHFSSSYGTPGSSATTLNRNMVAAHQLAKNAVEQRGIAIYNATMGGKLEVYPRVNLYDLLASK